jgi:hypothetical protein
MLTLVLAEDRAGGTREIVVTVDDGIGGGVGTARVIKDAQVIKWLGRSWESVDLIAAGLATAATDAPGGIKEDAFTAGMALEMFGPGGLGGLANGSAHPGGSKQAQKRSS